MILTVDIGNTNIVLGGFLDKELVFVSRLQTNKYKMADEYAIDFKAIIEYNGYKSEMFDGAIISCVVPPLTPTIKHAINGLFGCKVWSVSPGLKTGLKIITDDPGALGADLVCGAVAAVSRFKMPCIIVDLGTATKFSVLDNTGCFIGCSIMPGVDISLDALSKRTAQLPHIEFDEADNIIGTNSIECMRSGIVFGTASMIDGMIARINEELSEPATVVVTGGMARNIVPHCKTAMEYSDHLILNGLKDIFDKNYSK